MRHLLLPPAALALAACSFAFAAAGGGGRTAFRLQDASAACRGEHGTIVCRSLGVRTGLALAPGGAPRAVDEPIWWDASTPVLHRWRHGSLSCRDAGGVVLCRNGDGAAISVGPHRLAVSA